MKIAILIPTIKPGGAEKQAALLAATLSEENEVHFVSLWGKKNLSVIVQKFLEDEHVQIHYLSGKSFGKWKEYYQLLKQQKIEMAFNYLTICDVTGAMVEKLAGVKTVFNGIRNSRLAPAKNVLEWFAHNFFADYTIYNCQSGAKHFENLGFCKKKTIVIPNCFPNISKPIKRTDKDIKTIITVGRFEPQKDYLTAIKTIADLRKARQDFVFTIIGHGHIESQVRDWVEEYGLTDYTQVLIAPDNVQEILKSADIYLSTSLFEGTSNSIMEAMNWSIPVVATNVGDNNQLIKDSWNGYLISIGDYKRLSEHLLKLLHDDKLRIEMGIRGNERLHNYSVERFVENYSKVLEK